MNAKELLIELEEPLSRFSRGISAVKLMVCGLEQSEELYADGFYAIWEYLRNAEEDLQKALRTAGE